MMSVLLAVAAVVGKNIKRSLQLPEQFRVSAATNTPWLIQAFKVLVWWI